MLSHTLALLLAASAAQASDTTRASREAFTACLRDFVEQALQDQMTAEAFETEYPRACPAQEAAFRAAVIRRDEALRATRASAEDAANLEVEDARFNFADRFEMALPPQQPAQQQAAAETTAEPAEAQPAAENGQPAVQTASQPQ